MSVALFVESNAGELNELPATAQTIVFAHNNGVRTYHRISNGTRGKGQVWRPVDDISELPTEPVISVPAGVVVTDRDHALAELGQITNLTIKALNANEKADPITDVITHRDMVDSLIKRIQLGDVSLADYVVDNRNAEGVSNKVIIEPLSPLVTSTMTDEEEVRYTQVMERIENNVPAQDTALALITAPDPKWGKEYINRKFGKVTDFSILDYALENSVNVLVEGGAGSGKTMFVQGYASARGMRYFNVSNNTSTEPSELFGQWVPNPSGGYRWQDGAVTQLVRHGGVLLLNEVNFLPARVSTVLFSLLDYRREIQLMSNGGEVIKAHPDLLIVADMNYGYKGTQELNQAFNDRFGIKLEFLYDRTIEMKLLNSKAVLVLADQLREQYEKEELSTPVSTRSLVDLVKNAKHFGVDFAITSFVNGFNKDERNGVRLACETHKDNISIDLGLSTAPAHPISPDESEKDTYNFYSPIAKVGSI